MLAFNGEPADILRTVGVFFETLFAWLSLFRLRFERASAFLVFCFSSHLGFCRFAAPKDVGIFSVVVCSEFGSHNASDESEIRKKITTCSLKQDFLDMQIIFPISSTAFREPKL